MKWGKRIAIGLTVIVADVAVYVILGLLLLNYDDFYDESEGEYWSLESMTQSERWTMYGLSAWNVINVLAIVYLAYRLIKYYKKKNVLQQPV